MVVDFKISRSRKYWIAGAVRTGPYTGDRMMRAYFTKVSKWIEKSGLKGGAWIFRSLQEDDVPDEKMQFEAAIEIRGRKPSVRPPEGIELHEIPAGPVATVEFDPDKIADRVIYHGLESWLEWRRRYGEYERNGPAREIYDGDPWASARAWKSLRIEVPLKKLGKGRQ